MSALIAFLALLVLSLLLAPLFIRQLRVERRRCSLYEKLSGNILVTYGDRWNIIESKHLAPGTVLLIDPSSMFSPMPPLDTTGWAFKDRVVAGETITSFGEFQMSEPWLPIVSRPSSFVIHSVS